MVSAPPAGLSTQFHAAKLHPCEAFEESPSTESKQALAALGSRLMLANKLAATVHRLGKPPADMEFQERAKHLSTIEQSAGYI